MSVFHTTAHRCGPAICSGSFINQTGKSKSNRKLLLPGQEIAKGVAKSLAGVLHSFFDFSPEDYRSEKAPVGSIGQIGHGFS